MRQAVYLAIDISKRRIIINIIRRCSKPQHIKDRKGRRAQEATEVVLKRKKINKQSLNQLTGF